MLQLVKLALAKPYTFVVLAILIVLIAFVALANGAIGALPDVAGAPLTLERITGWIFAPLAWLMGIPWREALTAGIATVYQDLAVVPLMPVWRNFFLGSEPTKGWGPFRRFDAARAKATVGEISDALEEVYGRHAGQVRTISGV